MSDKFLAGCLNQALSWAESAGQLALERFQQPQQVDWKPDASPVTESDHLIENYLSEQITRAYPHHLILGEESALPAHELIARQAEYCWILDPIDGTRSYARGIPVFGIQLALCRQGVPILGLIHLPALRETVSAALGLGCQFNGQACRVSKRSQQEALVYVHERELARSRAPGLESWLQQVQLERNWGDCYSFVQVISGRAEAAMDPRMQVWDSAPLPILVQEAGGVFMDWCGQTTIWSGSALLCNAALAAPLRDIIQSANQPVL